MEDACVVGQWVEDQATELPVGFIAINEKAKAKGMTRVVDRVNQWLDARVANHKKLRGGLYIVAEIPKSPSGKILRRELARILKEKKSGGSSKL